MSSPESLVSLSLSLGGLCSLTECQHGLDGERKDALVLVACPANDTGLKREVASSSSVRRAVS